MFTYCSLSSCFCFKFETQKGKLTIEVLVTYGNKVVIKQK